MSRKLAYVFLPTPENCDICEQPLGSVMYDAKTVRGQWGCMCESCFQFHTIGLLGQGHGQKYRRRKDGKFAKEAG